RERAAHEPLDAEDRVFRIREGSVAGRGADEHAAVVVETDATGDQRNAAFVTHDDRPAVLDKRREAKGGAQVNTDDGVAHGVVAFGEDTRFTASASSVH